MADLRATMQFWQQCGVSPTRDDRKKEEMAQAIGQKRGWYRSSKEIMPVDAAVLSAMYDAGPGVFLRAKDLVKDKFILRAAGYDYLFTQKTVPVRGLQSCGKDMFDGYRLRVYRCMPRTFGSLNLKGAYHWDAKKEVKAVRCKDHKSSEELMPYVREQIQYLREWLQEETEEHGLTNLKVDEWQKFSMNKYQQIFWLLENYTEEQWYHLLNSRMFRYEDYKGECAWADEEAHCLHHNGELMEDALVYWVDDNDKPMLIHTSWRQYYADWSYNLPVGGEMKRLHDLDDPDAFIAEHVPESRILEEIRKSIQRCKTESKAWLMSTWTEREWVKCWADDEKTIPLMEKEYVYDEETGEHILDDQGNKKTIITDTQTQELVYVQKGTRGHYTLRWWERITQQRERDALLKEFERKDGEEINGWKFYWNRGQPAGVWKAMDSHTQINYRVSYITVNQYDQKQTKDLPWLFEGKTAALDFIAMMDKFPRRSMTMTESGPYERFFVRPVKERLSFTHSISNPEAAQPEKLTPKEVSDLCRACQPPDGYDHPYTYLNGESAAYSAEVAEHVKMGNIGLPTQEGEA